MEDTPYKEFRKDGWPFCPRCGEDELYSHKMLHWHGDGERPTIEECIKGGMTCYNCSWSSPKAAPEPVAESP
jgi:hypothetical protein